MKEMSKKSRFAIGAVVAAIVCILCVCMGNEGLLVNGLFGMCALGMAMTADDYDLIKMRSHNGSQRREDGADHYSENLRYAYLNDKDNVSFKQGTGVREVEESGSGRTRGLDPSNTKPGG